MKKRISKTNDLELKRMLNIDELQIYVGLGKTLSKAFADEIGATRKVGRRILFDKNVIDKYLDELGE